MVAARLQFDGKHKCFVRLAPEADATYQKSILRTTAGRNGPDYVGLA